jgi:hypothetical protein
MYITIVVLVVGAIIYWALQPLRHAHDSRYDLKVLWPIIKDRAQNLEHARLGFIIHTTTDPSWCCLLDDWDEDKFGEWVETVLI